MNAADHRLAAISKMVGQDTNPADSYRAADDALAALKDKLNRQRMADQLNPGDRITDPRDGQVKTIAKVGGYAPYAYMLIQFADGTWITPELTDLFYLAD